MNVPRQNGTQTTKLAGVVYWILKDALFTGTLLAWDHLCTPAGCLVLGIRRWNTIMVLCWNGSVANYIHYTCRVLHPGARRINTPAGDTRCRPLSIYLFLCTACDNLLMGRIMYENFEAALYGFRHRKKHLLNLLILVS